MALRWEIASASLRVKRTLPSSRFAAENSSSTEFIALRTSPPQAELILRRTPGSISGVTALRSARMFIARCTAGSTSYAGTCLNSNTVERLKIALNTQK